MNPRNHLLAFILIPLCLIAIGVSFYRFVITEDYMVTYEGACDPVTESCFVSCEDDACADVYYYTWIEKRAADVKAACGPDVSECDSAGECLPSDTHCVVTYCDPETASEDETCEDLAASEVEIQVEEEPQENISEEE